MIPRKGRCTQATDPTAVRAMAIAAKVRPQPTRQRPLFLAELLIIRAISFGWKGLRTIRLLGTRRNGPGEKPVA